VQKCSEKREKRNAIMPEMAKYMLGSGNFRRFGGEVFDPATRLRLLVNG
tara:strand:- start:8322 stop:8468 length:147 start_codon:yes stop_codon:yes gene_type:complete